MNLFLASLLVFILNLPFGMWRAKTKKFSLQWFLSIHVPIPFVIGIRFLFDLGFKWWTYPFLVGAFFTGQFIGKKILIIYLRTKKDPKKNNQSLV